MENLQGSLPNGTWKLVGAGAPSASASSIYCPYSDQNIPLIESSPEHIIPLALGGLNGFTLPVSKEFNSRIGSEVDGVLANDFLVMTARDKHGAKGHSGKHPEFVVRHATDAETGQPLQVTFGQKKGLRLWSPLEKRDVTGRGQKVSININLDLDVELRFVAKVALSAGYFFYGERFRRQVKHQDFRAIMNQRPNEMGDVLKTIEARYDNRFREPETDNDRILRAMAARFAPRSMIALMPNSTSFTVMVGILGHYLGMLSVPADTRGFPNSDEFRWGSFIALDKPIPVRDSVWKLLELMSRTK